MSLKKKAVIGALAALALVTGTASAFAAPAFASDNVNVRSGPGPGYGVVDNLRRGEPVDIDSCRGSWCYVIKPGPDGWVSANYLETERMRPEPRYRTGPGPGWGMGGGPGWDERRYYRPRRVEPDGPCIGDMNGFFCF